MKGLLAATGRCTKHIHETKVLRWPCRTTSLRFNANSSPLSLLAYHSNCIFDLNTSCDSMLAIQQQSTTTKQEAPFGVSTKCHAEFSIKTVGWKFQRINVNIQDVTKERSRIDAKLFGNLANLYKISTRSFEITI